MFLRKRIILTLVMFIISLILIFVGINKKEFESYYRKAINVCTQCIGIG